MRRRHTYLLLFAAPALLAAALAGLMVLVFMLAIFWVFIFGDDTWPAYANVLLAVFSVGTAATTFGVLLYHAHAEGRRREDNPASLRRPIAYAIAATLVLLIVPGLYAWHTSQRFDATPESACSFYCNNRGFPASGMPPRNTGDNTCTCYGPKGEVGASFPLPESGPAKK